MNETLMLVARRGEGITATLANQITLPLLHLGR